METSLKTGHSLVPATRKTARIYYPCLLLILVVLSVLDPSGLGILRWMPSPGGVPVIPQFLALKARSTLLVTAAGAAVIYCTGYGHPFAYLVINLLSMASSLMLAALYGVFVFY